MEEREVHHGQTTYVGFIRESAPSHGNTVCANLIALKPTPSEPPPEPYVLQVLSSYVPTATTVG